MTIFTVPGAPATITAQQKGISWKKRAVFTKSAVKAEQRRIVRCMEVMIADEWVPIRNAIMPHFTGAIECKIKVVFPLTLELAQKHSDQLSNPAFEVPHTVRPDVDNSSKLILDTLTKLRVWNDDSQVCDLKLVKRYGTAPRITIWIDQVLP